MRGPNIYPTGFSDLAFTNTISPLRWINPKESDTFLGEGKRLTEIINYYRFVLLDVCVIKINMSWMLTLILFAVSTHRTRFDIKTVSCVFIMLL